MISLIIQILLVGAVVGTKSEDPVVVSKSNDQAVDSKSQIVTILQRKPPPIRLPRLGQKEWEPVSTKSFSKLSSANDYLTAWNNLCMSDFSANEFHSLIEYVSFYKASIPHWFVAETIIPSVFDLGRKRVEYNAPLLIAPEPKFSNETIRKVLSLMHDRIDFCRIYIDDENDEAAIPDALTKEDMPNFITIPELLQDSNIESEVFAAIKNSKSGVSADFLNFYFYSYPDDAWMYQWVLDYFQTLSKTLTTEQRMKSGTLASTAATLLFRTLLFQSSKCTLRLYLVDLLLAEFISKDILAELLFHFRDQVVDLKSPMLSLLSRHCSNKVQLAVLSKLCSKYTASYSENAIQNPNDVVLLSISSLEPEHLFRSRFVSYLSFIDHTSDCVDVLLRRCLDCRFGARLVAMMLVRGIQTKQSDRVDRILNNPDHLKYIRSLLKMPFLDKDLMASVLKNCQMAMTLELKANDFTIQYN